MAFVPKTVREAHAILPTSVLSLYRRMLVSCKTFPSSNREGVYQAIRSDFRRDMHETDPEKVVSQLQHAVQGYRQLVQFNKNTVDEAGDININLEQAPFIKPAEGTVVPKPDIKTKSLWRKQSEERSKSRDEAFVIPRD